jgi:hypothetical protein
LDIITLFRLFHDTLIKNTIFSKQYMIRILIPTTMYCLYILATTIMFLSSLVVMVTAATATAEAEGSRTNIASSQPQQHLRHLTECDALRACYLVNIETRNEMKLIPGNQSNNTALLDLSKYPRGYSIRCDVTDTPHGESDFIKFIYDDMEHDEFALPRYMYGDSDMGDWINPVPYLQSCGRKTVRVQGHVWSKQCFDRTYSINMKCPISDTCPAVITNLILVDAVQRTDIMELSDYSIRSTMRAVPKECAPKTTESVQFIFDDQIV